MKILRTIAELKAWRSAQEGTVGLVPTMGAFHDGHLALMREAKACCEATLVTLFVNPTQFAPHEDFSRYPRQENDDCAKAGEIGVDAIFIPDQTEIYPYRTTTVQVSEVSEGGEGHRRPGHFEGVATVVSILFHLSEASDAFFGWKDLQQCVVIRRMVTDLHFPVKLHFVETYREPDGLAMSSRNRYLSASERAQAPQIYRHLQALAKKIFESNASVEVAKEWCQEAADALDNLGFQVHYLDLVDPETFKSPSQLIGNARLMIAATLGPVTLLDNIPIGSHKK